MKKLLIATLLLGYLNFGYAEKNKSKQRIQTKPAVCYASGKVSKTYVAPPFESLNSLKSAGVATSSIIVIYDDAFNANTQAKNAFQHAVDIWNGLISSPVPIYLYAYWYDQFEDNSTLGSCGPWDYVANFEEAPQKNTFYPVAMAEKMKGVEISDKNTPDMRARFNSKRTDWYFGTDGNVPANKYDFSSVVLHEIGHGLGYTGLFEETEAGVKAGYGGTSKYSGIFDRFVVNSTGKYLVDTTLFKNPSSQLLEQLKSENLTFKGQIPYDDAGLNAYPRLYAPSIWDEGSSIYHLNETTYPAGDVNSLMTPFADKQEVNRNPGPLSLGMLYEMGWKFTKMKHEEHPDIEKITDLKSIELYVESDYPLDTTKLLLIYSQDDFLHKDTVIMKKSSKEHTFTGNIKLTKEGIIKYYFSAKDNRQRITRLPGIAPERTYSFIYGSDNEAPNLWHEQVSYMLTNNPSAEIKVKAIDNIGVEKVFVEYLINNSTQVNKIELSFDKQDIYKGLFNPAKGTIADGDSIQYKVIVQDNSIRKNLNRLPVSGYYKFYISSLKEPVRNYFTDFNSKNSDFNSSQFTLKTPTNFDNGALHSNHPYQSPSTDDFTYDAKTILKYPIIIKNGGKIAYDEIVLVEPGETGSKFGDDNFWDYVIVQGSKDKGKTWKNLIDGYDSGANNNWKTTYNNSISGNNSTAVGKKSMFLKREFFLNQKGNFQVGDTILVQFLLYSDPYGNGWGWCIDNLNIQDPATSIPKLEISPAELMLYPNPADDRLILQASFEEEVGLLKATVYNNFGQAVLTKQISVNGKNIREIFEIGTLASGIYIVSIELDNGARINQKVVKK